MGTSSKRAANPGSFGQKKWIKLVAKDGHEAIISVKRPSRGRSLWKIVKKSRKGFKPIKLGSLNIKTKPSDSSPSVTAKPSVFQKMKTAFQRKAK